MQDSGVGYVVEIITVMYDCFQIILKRAEIFVGQF